MGKSLEVLGNFGFPAWFFGKIMAVGNFRGQLPTINTPYHQCTSVTQHHPGSGVTPLSSPSISYSKKNYTFTHAQKSLRAIRLFLV
jgi:hypothetical protein